MSLLRPFSGFIPSAEHAHQVVGPPSSMLTSDQQSELRDGELSFRHRVGRGAKAPEAEAMRWLQQCIDVGALQRVTESVIVHRLTRNEFVATGVLADVSIDAYNDGLIKRHEATIEKSQAKMATYMTSTRILGNAVALAHRSNASVSDSLSRYANSAPDVAFVAVDGTSHELWVVGDAQAEELCDELTVLYITDGHHRLAAASLLAKTESLPNMFVPAAVFSEHELAVDAYARVLKDASVEPRDLLDWLHARFELVEVDQRVPRPTRRAQIGVRIDRRSFLLSIDAHLIPSDLYGQLDVNLLSDLILDPFAGVSDARTDDRMRFTADTADADHDVDGATAWFLPFPTSVPDVMAVADAGQTMPPKSTFFMPKVPSGLMVRPIDANRGGSQELR